MKAVLLTRTDPTENHPYQLQEIANPMPAPGEILLQVTACGVCRSNLHMIGRRVGSLTACHQSCPSFPK
jgi:alcohol dehydrogenase, propanol-preferring